MLRITNLLQYH